MATNKFNFTKAKLQGLPSAETGRVYCRDTKEPRLGLTITGTGSKSFHCICTVEGRSRRISLGKFPDLTVPLARQKAGEMAAEVAATGRNPVNERRRGRAESLTLGDALNLFLAERDLKPSTQNGYRRSLNAMWGDRFDKPLKAITRAEVLKRYRDMSDAPAYADHAIRALRALFNFMAARSTDENGDSPYSLNPVDVITQAKVRYKIQRRKRAIAPERLNDWWNAVHEEQSVVTDMFVFVLLTGCRIGEASSLEWADLDFRSRTFILSDTKNRETVTLPLPSFIAKRLVQNRKKSGLVFTLNGSTAPALSKPITRITRRCGFRISPHDLRRTFASTAESLDMTVYTLKALLNHMTDKDVTAGYIVQTPERLRKASQRIETEILRFAGVDDGITCLKAV